MLDPEVKCKAQVSLAFPRKEKNYSVSLSNKRYGYAAKFEQGELARYEVGLADLTCSCPYSFQYELPCCHLIAVAQCHGRTRDNDA